MKTCLQLVGEPIALVRATDTERTQRSESDQPRVDLLRLAATERVRLGREKRLQQQQQRRQLLARRLRIQPDQGEQQQESLETMHIL